MGTTIMDMLRRVQALRASEDATVGAIELTSKQLADVNRKQLKAGRDANGELIGDRRPYKFFKLSDGSTYPEFKNRMNSLPGFGNPDLYLTGSFHNSIRVYITGSRLNWEATDSKAADLLSKYGSVLGVYDNVELDNYKRGILYPLSIKIIKAATGMQ